jgi:hypothetical protein
VGPLIAAAGFALFAVPSAGGSYWTTFFPAFIVLGFGMAVSVAPLTTTVMTAVNRDHSGTASGINNAVARVAGLLAIAIFGIVMVSAFATRLDRGLALIEVPQNVRDEVRSDRTKLAAITLPADLDQQFAEEAKADVAGAFIFAFRIISFCCAALAITSAATAAGVIDSRSILTPSQTHK